MDVLDVVRERRQAGKVCSRPRRTPQGGFTRCWSRDYSACPSCAALNALYVKRLISSGFVDGSRFYLLTLTAPSFGRVHMVPHSAADALFRCACGEVHRAGDGLAGVPIDPERYQYAAAVKWNDRSSELFRRSMDYLGRELPELSWCAVREYQKRGSIHFHIIIRVPEDYRGSEVVASLRKVISYQAGSTRWGRSVDVQEIAGDDASSTVRYLSKVLGYTVKALGRTANGLSEDQRGFYKRLDAASVRAGFSQKKVAGYGYGGQIFTKAKSWSDLTKADLVAESKQFASKTEYKTGQDELSRSIEVNAQELRAVAAAMGNREDFTVDADAPDRLRERLVGLVVEPAAPPVDDPFADVPLSVLDDLLSEVDLLDI